MKKILLCSILLVMVSLIYANVRVNSYVENRKIGLQDNLKYTIEISDESNKHIEQPTLPDIPNFRLLGTSSSHSTSMQIVNGRMTSSVTVSYTYQLKPEAVGNFLIPPVRINIKGKNYVTEAISVEVIKGTSKPLPPSSSNVPGQSQRQSDSLEDNLFIAAEVSKKNVYRGEPLILEYKLYTRYDIANLSFLKEPEFSDFWKETIMRAEYKQLQRARYHGQMFNMMPLLSVALFPTSSGTMTIPEIEMSVDIRVEARSFFDFGSTRQFTIASKPIKIQVKDIPSQNRPANFSGAVGEYKIKSNISNDKLKVGESFTYTMEISGTGNIAQFDEPVLPDINHLRFLRPEITTNVHENKISGSKIIKYLVIAQEKGTFQIPAIPFSYFDTKEERFKTLSANSYEIKVEEGSSVYIPSTSAQTSVLAEALDIRFIITDTDLENTKLYFRSFFFWLIWFLILLTIIPSILIAKEREKSAENLDYTRQKQANKILKKYLKEASANSNKMEFYAYAQNGLQNYLADKCKLPRGTTTEEIIQKLHQKNLDETLVKNVKHYFEICNQSRFMPGGFSQDKIKDDYATLQKLVHDLSKWKVEKS